MSATAVDAAGNIIVVGNFSGTVSFGATTLTSAGYFNAFVAKWSPGSGSFIWAYRAGGTVNDEASAVAINGNNIYIAGSFRSRVANFGPISMTNGSTINVSDYPSDLFVAKLTDAGASADFVWVKQPAGTYAEECTGLVVNGNQVYVTGNIYGTAPPGSPGQSGCNGCLNYVAFGTISLPATMGWAPDGFVAKLDDAGTSATWIWATRIGGPGDDYIKAVALNGNSIYYAGRIEQPPFGLPTGTWYTIGKLTDVGSTFTLTWTQGSADTGNDFASALVTNGSDVYVAGRFKRTFSYASTILRSAGSDDVFVAKLVDTGAASSFAWAQRAGGSFADDATALAVKGSSVYTAGYFGYSNISNKVWVARFVDSGAASNFVWEQQSSTGGGASALALNWASVWVAGAAGLPASFGSLSVGGPARSSAGFLASLLDATGLATVSTVALSATVLFPNPAHGHATVQLPVIPGTATATLTLLDALGRTLRTQTAATNSKAELDLTGLAPGLYALRVMAGTQTATRHLVVE